MLGDGEPQAVQDEKIQIAVGLNEAFRQGKEAWQVLGDLQALKKPILVDFNNVLAGNRFPLTPNPDGKSVLNSLTQIGDVVIATTAESWEDVYAFLKNEDMWREDIVLMTNQTYRFLYDQWASDQAKFAREALVGQLRETLAQRGIKVPEGFEQVSPAEKPLSLLFNKPFDIPLIDDSALATVRRPFPGIMGVHVEKFMDESEKQTLGNITNGGMSLTDAVEKVRDYYTSLHLG